ncbi:hypothetical protein GCM10007301_53470 [Azorhizobium oxalatiphilum]|uniref:Uncharacterized protein n=1 Tax=Azorhizobium oxalatiphilum TaxID=980631 RepID=A0A917CEV4_9HYPH|nr:hypothetical protein [Azorhizobium oxalatiphilum]GGF86858.1 hypothetical protein GCM10007301_53470 [Azorhizobium oxalatiphilum]
MSISRKPARAAKSRKTREDAKAGRTDRPAPANDFEPWLRETFADEGSFTSLVILVEIGETHVAPLASTFLNFIGDEITWPQVVSLFAGSGRKWDGVAFFPQLDGEGPLENDDARTRLRSIEQRVREDRLVLNEGQFFDGWGRRLQIEEISLS